MQNRITQLEAELTKLSRKPTRPSELPTNSNEMSSMSSIPVTFYGNHDSHLFGEAQVTSRSIMHKSRLFGQSHWSNAVAGVSHL